ncbi:hypothetical protein [Agrobacterium rubi]|uniref:Uncharacterized protein n=1 Tax=Agrobacterium rubi TaxID=28099 RepID=A0AAE7RBU1_9HYPH|nr:hypothetical protein [Agrobacterium rubi]NTE89060.1 hypothetical protein [Agrobacterium rubi]NTF04281.1 hypothetical protein [Agrobacterium rubi]NTF38612.1 hypothetical protein [Agrobacterium rubi]OCJ47343.1 hypothetical protein A6U92_14025 [Agrobacterium rubi]QTG02406.1 hypothetical protein G6M88_18540 [Agrobacterium rubi]
MRRVAVGAGVSVVLCLVTAAVAQDIEVSSLDLRKTTVETVSAPVRAASPDGRYIVDVSGKQVRLVGPRFFPDNSKEVELFGRTQALAREDARAQVASK